MTRRTIVSTAAALAALAAAPGLASAAYPGENGAIAYHSGRDGDYEVYTVQADGSGDTRRTTAPLTDQDPAYSRDGLRIAFTAQRDGGTGLDVWVMAANGSNPLNLSRTAGDDVANAFSPDGTRILFHSRRDGGGDFDLFTMAVDGTDVRQVTNAAGDETWGQYSPDGTKVVYKASSPQQDLWIVSSAGGTPTQLTNNADTDDYPEFSPDGTKVVWQTTGNIALRNADGSGTTTLLTSDANFDGHPTFSPDGTKIAFFSGRDDYRGEIYVMNADGSGITRVTTNTAADLDPRWGNLNHPPTCASLSDAVTGPAPKTIQLTCTDPDGQPLSFAITTPPAHGALGTINQAAGTVVYTPTRGYAGPDAFTFTATDGGAEAAPATASLTVIDGNRAPTCTDVSAKTTAGKAVTVTLSCTDPDGDAVTIRTAATPRGGKLGAIAGSTVKYTPNAATTGSDSFTYVASDGLRDSAAATVKIAVEAVVVAAPGPRDATVEVNPKGGFWLAVWYTVPKACGKSCKTTVEVRTRRGKRLFDASLLGKLRGDGPVLGRTIRTVKAGQRVKIWIPLSSKALLKSRWSTVGGFRATDSRVRFLYRSTTGTKLEGVRDGRVKVWIHRLQKGDFPGLERILG